MAKAPNRPNAETSIMTRVPLLSHDLINGAASSIDTTPTEFVLESARLRAIDVLLDQRIFRLDPSASEALAEMLANPPAPVDALLALMASKSPWSN